MVEKAARVALALIYFDSPIAGMTRMPAWLQEFSYYINK